MAQPHEFSKDLEKNNLPDFKSGDTVCVNVKVIEGGKERIQKYEGIVLARKGTGTNLNGVVVLSGSGAGTAGNFTITTGSGAGTTSTTANYVKSVAVNLTTGSTSDILRPEYVDVLLMGEL